MWFVYVLLSEVAPKTYVGVTPNLEKRLHEHNSGCGAYSKKFKPWRIVHDEKFPDRKEAIAREKYLKSHTGRKFLKKLLKNSNYAPW